MKVILLTDVPKVGNRHDVKEFKDGYAINVLISKGLAEMATPQALGRLASKQAEVNKKKEEETSAFESLIKKVQAEVITIEAKANDKGHLFKAISARDVTDAIKRSTDFEIDEKAIVMDHIKEKGKHTVILKKGSVKGEIEITIA